MQLCNNYAHTIIMTNLQKQSFPWTFLFYGNTAMAVAHKSHPFLKLKTSLPFNHKTTKILKSYRFPWAFLFYDNTAPHPSLPRKSSILQTPSKPMVTPHNPQKLSLTTWGYPDRWCCPMVCGGGGRPVALPPGGGGGPPPIPPPGGGGGPPPTPGGLGMPGLGGGGIRWPGGGAMPCPWGGGATPCPWGGRKRGWGPGAAGPGKGTPPVWPWPSADGEAPAQCTTQHTGHGFVWCSGTMVVAWWAQAWGNLSQESWSASVPTELSDQFLQSNAFCTECTLNIKNRSDHTSCCNT